MGAVSGVEALRNATSWIQAVALTGEISVPNARAVESGIRIVTRKLLELAQ